MTITRRALTNTMHDTKYYMEVEAEDRVYSKWEKEKKASLRLKANQVEKRNEWTRLFEKTVLDDSYLLGEVF